MSSIYLANFKPALTSVTFLAASSPAELYTYWSYSLNGGSYVPFYEGSTYRANCTITGLTEGTTYTVKVRAYLSGVGTLYYTTTYSFSTLKSQTPPTVTCTLSAPTTVGFTITGSANYPCKTWQYSIDGGTWQSLSASTSASSVSKVITGLSENKEYSVRVRATRTYNGVRGTSSAKSITTLKSQTPPTVTCSVTSVTHNSFKVTGTANDECKTWQYSLNDGSTWASLSASTSATSVSKVITGLTPATLYQVRVRATRTYNDVRGTSSSVSASTLGSSKMNSVNTVIADAETVSITFNVTVPSSSYSHNLRIRDGGIGGDNVLVLSGISITTGTNTLTLTAGQRSTLLSYFPDKKNFVGTFALQTILDGSQVGRQSGKDAIITTTEANSRPTFPGWEWDELTEKVDEFSPDWPQRNISNLRIRCETATAKNGASIVGYGITLVGRTVTSSTTTIDYGTPTSCASNALWEVWAEDSRGYKTYSNWNRSVICYVKPSVLEWGAYRKDGIDEQTGLYMRCAVLNTGANGLFSSQYRYREARDPTYGEWLSIGGGTRFDETSGNRHYYVYDKADWETFDPEKSYVVQIRVRDEFRQYSDTITLTIARGTPLASFRDGMIGINNFNPQSALDIKGETNNTLRINGNVIRDGIQTTVTNLNTRIPTFFEQIHKSVGGGERYSWTLPDNSFYLVMVSRSGYEEVVYLSKRTELDATLIKIAGSRSQVTLSGNVATVTAYGQATVGCLILRLG